LEPTSNAQPVDDSTPGGCLLRLFWMGFGNAALIYAALHLADTRDLVVANAMFFGIAGALLIARAVDIRWFHGMTTDSRKATLADLRRYAVGLVVVVAVLWALARAVRSSCGTFAE